MVKKLSLSLAVAMWSASTLAAPYVLHRVKARHNATVEASMLFNPKPLATWRAP
jgi:hypothetical protein